MRFPLLALALFTVACADKPASEDLSKLSRQQQMQRLRLALKQDPSSTALQQQLGDAALLEGEAAVAIEAFQKSGDAKGEAIAKLWMDPANFAAPPGSAPELWTSAAGVQLAIDSSFATRADVLAKLNRAGRLFFEAGDRDSAGKCIQRATPLVAAVLKVPRPSLYAYHLAADYDELYGDMLFGNRHWGDARALYQNNVMRFKNWDPPGDYTRKRLEAARKKVAECEKKMLP